jgi:hypothetical protein
MDEVELSITAKRNSRDLKNLKPEILEVAKETIRDSQRNPIPAMRRFRRLSEHKNPKIHSVDVFSNKSYKISVEINDATANLRRIATHKEIDQNP